ncbi:hypothetical protein ACLOJK_012219 [Asimina triloba]
MGMDRNVFLVLGFAILVFVAGEIPRALAAAGTNKAPPSPIPNPTPSAKIDAQNKNATGSNTTDSHPKAKSDTNLTDASKANSTTPKVPSASDDSQSLPSPSHGSKKGNNEKDATKNAAGPTNDTDLNASPKKEQDGACKVRCKDEGNLTACLLDSGPDVRLPAFDVITLSFCTNTIELILWVRFFMSSQCKGQPVKTLFDEECKEIDVTH